MRQMERDSMLVADVDGELSRNDGLTRAADAEAAWLRWASRSLLEVPTADLVAEASRMDADALASNVARQAARNAGAAGFEAVADVDALHELSLDFTQLFCACREGAPYPYESVYADDARLLMRPVRDDVARAYEEAGFDARAASPTEPEDHLGLQLAFMAWLVERGDAQRLSAFVNAHAGWVARLVADVREQAQTGFYPAVLQLARALINDAIGCCH